MLTGALSDPSLVASVHSLIGFGAVVLAVPATILVLVMRGGALQRRMMDWFRRRDSVVREGALYVGTVGLLLVVARIFLLAVTTDQYSTVGLRREPYHCPHLTCIFTPDSGRYLTASAYFAQALGHVWHFGTLANGGVGVVGARDGVFYGFLGGIVAAVSPFTPAEGDSIVSALATLVLAWLLQRTFRKNDWPALPLVLFSVSALALVYGNLVMKESLDALLIVTIALYVVRPSDRAAPFVAIAIIGLYFDRTYDLYILAGFAALSILYRLRISRAMLIVSAVAAAVVVGAVVLSGSLSSDLVRSYHARIRGHGITVSSSIAGFVRSLISPISPHMSGTNYIDALFNAPVIVAYVVLIWTAVVTFGLQTQPGWLRRTLNPFLVSFVAAMAAFGIVYGGFYRAREALSPLVFLALASTLAAVSSGVPRRRA